MLTAVISSLIDTVPSMLQSPGQSTTTRVAVGEAMGVSVAAGVAVSVAGGVGEKVGVNETASVGGGNVDVAVGVLVGVSPATVSVGVGETAVSVAVGGGWVAVGERVAVDDGDAVALAV